MSNTHETENQAAENETKTYTQAEVDELISGLQNKNGELLGKLKGANAKLKEYDGVDLAAFKEWQKKTQDDEEERAS